jgi:hypothetical protein
VDATVYDRSKLAVDAAVDGPAVLEQAESTTVVPPGWTGRLRGDGALVVRRAADGAGDGRRERTADATGNGPAAGGDAEPTGSESR